jgi:hypothetical protein
MFWYILVIPAIIWTYAIVEPDKHSRDQIERGPDLYQHSDGRQFKNDWANNEDDL